jgi:hypothetical protein
MSHPLQQFDFALLDGADFREDSVREEIVVPLLKALGYSAAPPHKIIRSRPLTHPYVYIGTAKKSVTIIPDYVLQRDGSNAWILDAKAPGEIIASGKNAEQAYSYAIHPDIRVEFYGLCNGRRLVVFHISEILPRLDIDLSELETKWQEVLALLSTRAAWPQGIKPGFLPDMGVALYKSGLALDQNGKKVFQLFTGVSAFIVFRLTDEVYSLTARYDFEYVPQYLITFDFTREVYEKKFLPALPQEIREEARHALTQQPFRYRFASPDTAVISVAAEPGDTVHTNENESYCPFKAIEFF